MRRGRGSFSSFYRKAAGGTEGGCVCFFLFFKGEEGDLYFFRPCFPRRVAGVSVGRWTSVVKISSTSLSSVGGWMVNDLFSVFFFWCGSSPFSQLRQVEGSLRRIVSTTGRV